MTNHEAAYVLTPQQRKALELIAAGLSHEQIAVRMKIGRQSVKGHIVNICDRFFARDKHFRMVIQTKLLEDNDA